MIKGNINNNLEVENDRIIKALKWLRNLEEFSTGTYEIIGKEIYAMVQEYTTKEIIDLKWEGHKKYIDIQYIFEGRENIGFSNIKKMEKITDYNSEGDYQFFEGVGVEEKLNSGDYLILFPEDIHMPCIGNGQKVKKIVVKVRI